MTELSNHESHHDEPFLKQSMQTYLNSLAQRSSTPGGGAVAAISGAQMVALIAMVCEFTQTDDVTKTQIIKRIKTKALIAKDEFITLGNTDIEAFNAVMRAYKMSKSTTLERKEQSESLQIALIAAADAPLKTMRLALTFTHDMNALFSIGNRNLITDVGIAALLIPTTVEAAQMNILINLKSITDTTFCTAAREEMGAASTAIKQMQALSHNIIQQLSTI